MDDPEEGGGVDASDKIWVKDEEHCWLLGRVTGQRKGKYSVEIMLPGASVDGEARTVAAKNTKDVDPTHLLHTCWDIAQMNAMSGAPLIDVLRRRLVAGHIYTLVSDILIAVNPYIFVEKNVTIEGAENYQLGQTPPHIYTTAAVSFNFMMDKAARVRNQTCIVSGESGAGKTEACKAIMRYLAHLEQLSAVSSGEAAAKVAAKAAAIAAAEEAGDADTLAAIAKVAEGEMPIEDQVLACNPFLEAFGNAKTNMNDNSSRFGKFLKIMYDARGRIKGAMMQTYLLEKARITGQGPNERNYHIFYQLCKGLTAAEKKRLKLEGCAAYKMITFGGLDAVDVPRINDVKEFAEAREAMVAVGMKEEEEQWAIFRVCAALMQMFNVEWKDRTPGEDDFNPQIAEPHDPSCLRVAAENLGISPDGINGLEAKLAVRLLVKPGSIMSIPCTPAQCRDNVGALCRKTFNLVFNWLGDCVNRLLAPTEECELFVGILDIFGFEIFESNSFEQLCINFANEKLQRLFNKHVFENEQREYEAEEIDWSSISFKDNSPCCLLVEGKSKFYIGLLARLDDKSKSERAENTDKAYALECVKFFKREKGLEKRLKKECKKSTTVKQYLSAAQFINFPRVQPYSWFEIVHFAGPVRYQFANFLDKNKDKLHPHLADMMKQSELTYLSELFGGGQKAKGKKKQKKPEVPTIASKFVKQLGHLVSTMEACVPHYVRCVKPNDKKFNYTQGVCSFEAEKAMRQLLYAGVMETVAIRQAGFPTRELFSDFWRRCKMSKWNIIAGIGEDVSAMDGAAAVLTACFGTAEASGQWLLGKTKVFGKDGLLRKIRAWHQQQVLGRLQQFCVVRMKRLHFLEWSVAKMKRRFEHMAVELKQVQALARFVEAHACVEELRAKEATRLAMLGSVLAAAAGAAAAAAAAAESTASEASETAALCKANEERYLAIGAASRASKAAKTAADAVDAMCASAEEVVRKVARAATDALFAAQSEAAVTIQARARVLGPRHFRTRALSAHRVLKRSAIGHAAQQRKNRMRRGWCTAQALVRGGSTRRAQSRLIEPAKKISEFLVTFVNTRGQLNMWLAEMEGACSAGDSSLSTRLIGRSDARFSALRTMEISDLVNVRNRATGQSPLHFAAASGDIDTMLMLMRYGADPAVRDYISQTPLQLTCRRGDEGIEAAQLLLANAKSQSARQWMLASRSEEGLNAIEIALECDGPREGIIEILARSGSAGGGAAVNYIEAEREKVEKQRELVSQREQGRLERSRQARRGDPFQQLAEKQFSPTRKSPSPHRARPAWAAQQPAAVEPVPEMRVYDFTPPAWAPQTAAPAPAPSPAPAPGPSLSRSRSPSRSPLSHASPRSLASPSAFQSQLSPRALSPRSLASPSAFRSPPASPSASVSAASTFSQRTALSSAARSPPPRPFSSPASGAREIDTTNLWRAVDSPAHGGRTYYVNMLTRESRWEMPDEMRSAGSAKTQSSPSESTRDAEIKAMKAELAEMKRKLEESEVSRSTSPRQRVGASSSAQFTAASTTYENSGESEATKHMLALLRSYRMLSLGMRSEGEWYYEDAIGTLQGPFVSGKMAEWYEDGLLDPTLPLRLGEEGPFVTLQQLIDASCGGAPFRDTSVTQTLFDAKAALFGATH